jgi:hypothetical protein
MNLQDTLQTIRQKAFPKRYALETELAGLRDEHAHVIAELDTVQGELAATREQDAKRLADLQQQLDVISSDRRAAEVRAETLAASLAEAQTRQRTAEHHINSLEAKLDETRSQHEAGLELTQENLLRLQSEQQNLLALQTDLAKTFHEVGKQLLDATRVQPPQRMSRLQATAMAGLLFLSGALLSGLFMRQEAPRIDLTPLQTGIIDLKRLMQTHFESHNELLRILTDTLDRETVGQVQPAPGSVVSQRLAERQRADLALLGFKADDSLSDFRALYLPNIEDEDDVTPDEVDAVLGYYADLARKDSRKYQLDSDVLAAIRLASKRTGVEFSFLMELAATESNFRPAARAPTSTAVGLYQFKEETWLDAIKAYGARYGLEKYSRRIEYTAASGGVMQPAIEDADLHAAALDLRLDPRLSALLAAEHARTNMRQLNSRLDRTLDRTDIYLTHFFGASGAISFLKALAENPGQIAGEIFPGPASRNRSIFQDKSRKPRTVAEVYRLFARKFNTSRFRDSEPG